METIRIRDTGWKKVGSGINIPDPQHWLLPVSIVDPGHFGPDQDPRIHASDQWIRIPAIFVLDLQDANKKNFSAYYFLKVHLRGRDLAELWTRSSRVDRASGFDPSILRHSGI
jgi:hypothetical protein